MNFQIKDIVKFNLSVKNLSNDKLPLTCAYKISKIQHAMENDLNFYQTKYFEIVEKYGKKDENGNLQYSEDGMVVLLDQDKIEAAQIEISELENMSIELDIENYLLDISDFDQTSRMTVSELNSLIPFMK